MELGTGISRKENGRSVCGGTFSTCQFFGTLKTCRHILVERNGVIVAEARSLVNKNPSKKNRLWDRSVCIYNDNVTVRRDQSCFEERNMAMASAPGKTTSASKSETYVSEQLTRAERRIRLLDLATAGFVFLAGTLAFAVLMALCDRHWKFSDPVRQLGLVLYLAGSAIFLGLTVVRPLLRRINPYYAARQVEQTLPGAKNSVINWLDLHEQKLAPAIRNAIGGRAAKELAKADLEKAISGQRALIAGLVTATLGALFLFLFLAVGPSQFGSLIYRAFAPFGSSDGIPTRTRLRILRPESGNARIAAGLAVTIAVQVDGRVPDPGKPDAVKLHWRHDPHQPYQVLPLAPQESAREWAVVLSVADVREGFLYKVTGGDAETEEYKVAIVTAPIPTEVIANYHYRPYVGKVDEIRRGDRKIEALRGTEVTMLVRTNRTVKEGKLLLETRAGKRIIDGSPAADNDLHAFQVSFVIEDSGLYQLSFQSSEEESYTDSLLYPVIALADHAPTVEITKPAQDTEEPANGLLKVTGKAGDDIGVASLTLQFRAVGGPPLTGKVYRADKGGLKLAVGGYPLTVDYQDALELLKIKTAKGEAYPLQPGMELEYWLEAADACDYLKPNVTQSKHYKVRIVAPQKDDKKQQQEREQARKEQEEHDARQEQQRQQQEKERQKKLEQEQERLKQQKQGMTDKPEEGPGEPKPNPGNQQNPEDKKKEEEIRKEADRIRKELDKEKQQDQQGQKGNQGQDPDKGKQKGENPAAGQSKEGGNEGQGENKEGGKEGQQKQAGQQKEGGQQGQQGASGKEGGKPDGKPENKRSEGKDGGKQGMEQQGGQASEAKDEGKQGQSGQQAGQAGAGKGSDKGQAKKEAGQEKTAGAQGGQNTPADGKEGGKDSGQGAQQARGDNKELSPKQASSAGKDAGQGGPKGAQDSATAKSGEQGAAGPKNQGQSKDGGEKGGDQKLARGAGKGDPDHKPPSEANLRDLQRLAQSLRNQDARKREQAEQDLNKIKGQAQDEKMRDLARKLLEELQKDPNNQTGEAKASQPPPPGQPTGQCKGGGGAPKEGSATAKNNGGMGKNGQGESKDGGKDEKSNTPGQGTQGQNPDDGKGEEAQAKAAAKTRGAPAQAGSPQGGQGEKTVQGQGVLEQLLQDRAQQVQNNPVDPLSQKATEAQLEDFKTKLDKKELERLGMTEEAREQFLKNYAELVKRDQANAAEKPETVPPSQQGGNIASTVGKPAGPSTNGPTGDTVGPNRGQPPPGYRDDYAEFTRMLAKPPSVNPKSEIRNPK